MMTGPCAAAEKSVPNDSDVRMSQSRQGPDLGDETGAVV